ncbi:MAG: 30S ribosomal protein S19 [Thermoplasmata archaeon]|nr:30S ribosomal protein S19 [Thermoplasmata archaeon]
MAKTSTAKSSRRKARKGKGLIGVRRKKEFAYRGYSLEELQNMSLEEVLDILPARSRRSLKRGLTDEQQKFLERVKNNKSDKPVRTHRRDMVILPQLVGTSIAIHNGKQYNVVTILPEMIGHYLGEFALTRQEVRHTGPGVGATRSSKYMPLK